MELLEPPSAEESPASPQPQTTKTGRTIEKKKAAAQSAKTKTSNAEKKKKAATEKNASNAPKTRTRKSSESLSPVHEFLALLAEADRKIWEPMLLAGTEIQILPLNFVVLREDFRTMDRNRFTCYILDREGEPLRPIRTSVQIREPLALLLKWDEMGALIIYDPDGRLRSE